MGFTKSSTLETQLYIRAGTTGGCVGGGVTPPKKSEKRGPNLPRGGGGSGMPDLRNVLNKEFSEKMRSKKSEKVFFKSPL